MNGEGYTWLVTAHGHLAVLALAIGLHPIVTLRLRASVSRTSLLTADLAAVLVALPFTLGLLIYPVYRATVKPALFLAQREAVLRFETKEHLAAMAVGLTVGGALTLRAAGRTRAGKEAAWMMLVCGWVLTGITALLGVYVHGWAHPAFGR